MRTLNYLLLAVRNPPRERRALHRAPRSRASRELPDLRPLRAAHRPQDRAVGWRTRWSRSRQPPAASSSRSEEARAVRETYEEWTKLGLKVVQEPTEMDFGFTFVVEDPDGHRLRPFVLAEVPR